MEPPLRLFTCDARYQKFIEATLALALADVARDKERRANKQLPTIPTQLTLGEPGTLTIAVGLEDSVNALTKGPIP